MFPSGLLAGLPLASSFQKICIPPFWLVGHPSAGLLLPKNFVLFASCLLASLFPVTPFQNILYIHFWLIGWPSVSILLPQNFVLFPSGLLARCLPKILYCSLLACWPAASPKFCIVPLWKVGWPLAGILLPQNFVLFPFVLYTRLRPVIPFPKILYFSLLACWPAFN